MAGCAPQLGHVPICGGACSDDCRDEFTDGCSRLVSKVHVATKYVSSTGHCYTFVAYDHLCGPAPDGKQHLKARLNVVDITDELAPVYVNTYSSTVCSTSNHNDFSSTVAANQFSNAILWYFERQVNGDGCNTRVTGWTSSNLGGVGTWTSLGTLDGPFPTISFSATHGLGDYIGTVTNGLIGGKFLATWSRPVAKTGPANDECMPCGSGNYSLAIYGSEITP